MHKGREPAARLAEIFGMIHQIAQFFSFVTFGGLVMITGAASIPADELPRTEVVEIVRQMRPGDVLLKQERRLILKSLREDAGERLLCDLLSAFHHGAEPDVEFLDGIQQRFRDLSDDKMFAKFRAAAVLMKWRPMFAEAQAWVEPHLTSKSKRARMLAAMALGSVRPEAKEAIARLVPLLDDKSAAVRVMAARSYFLLTGSAALVIGPLTDSLTAEPETIMVRPISISESIGDHRHTAAAMLGNLQDWPDQAAFALCQVLEDEDDALRWVVFRSLASLQCTSDVVLQELTRLERHANRKIAVQASMTLASLIHREGPKHE